MMTTLLVNDDKDILDCISEILEAMESNIVVLTAENGQKAIEILNNHKIHLMVTDLEMPLIDGYQLITYANSWFPNLPVLIMSGIPCDLIQERLEITDVLKNVECFGNPVRLSDLAVRITQKCEGPETG
jgi:CheY-like chemotaxis protein